MRGILRGAMQGGLHDTSALLGIQSPRTRLAWRFVLDTSHSSLDEMFPPKDDRGSRDVEFSGDLSIGSTLSGQQTNPRA